MYIPKNVYKHNRIVTKLYKQYPSLKVKLRPVVRIFGPFFKTIFSSKKKRKLLFFQKYIKLEISFIRREALVCAFCTSSKMKYKVL